MLAEFPLSSEAEALERDKQPRVAIVGRPNVGKSTLVNALVGEERVIAFGEPGTTRDAIEVPFERGGRRYTLIDTAGLRKRGKQGEAVENFSIVKTLQAIEAANVAVLVLDAADGVSEQDAHVAGYILERGRAVVRRGEQVGRRRTRRRASASSASCAWKLGFLGFADTHFISAKSGKGMGELMRSVDGAYAAAMAKLLDAEAHARADRGGGAPVAAAQGAAAAQAALRAPGRAQSAARHHPRQFARRTCPTATGATSKATSATPSSCTARRSASSSAPGAIPTRAPGRRRPTRGARPRRAERGPARAGARPPCARCARCPPPAGNGWRARGRCRSPAPARRRLHAEPRGLDQHFALEDEGMRPGRSCTRASRNTRAGYTRKPDWLSAIG